jgi:hypothetical protein
LNGIKAGEGRIRLTAHKRSITSPVGWFSDPESFDYPFPLLLMPGGNDVEVEVIGEGEVDWSSAWYCCRDGFTSDDLYSSWSWPILWADMQHPEFIELFINNVFKIVRRFGVDAVHVDATWPNQPDMSPPCAEIIQHLQEELPDIVLSSEAVMSFSEMGIWAFSPITLLNRGGFFGLKRQNMPKVQVLTQYEHGQSQAYQPAGEARELNWLAIHLPYPRTRGTGSGAQPNWSAW